MVRKNLNTLQGFENTYYFMKLDISVHDVVINLVQHLKELCSLCIRIVCIDDAHKFLCIVATRCIDNFRDEDCPSLIIYLNGEVIKNSHLVLKFFIKFFFIDI